MNAPTHLLGGAVAGLTVVALTNSSLESMTLPADLFGSVIIFSSLISGDLPDLDRPHTYISNRLPVISWFACHLTKHRSIMHTPFFEFIILAILWLITGLFVTNFWIKTAMIGLMIGFITGYTMHLFLDMITPMGIMIWYPLSYDYVSIAHLNGKRDHLKVDILLLIIAGFDIAKLLII